MSQKTLGSERVSLLNVTHYETTHLQLICCITSASRFSAAISLAIQPFHFFILLEGVQHFMQVECNVASFIELWLHLLILTEPTKKKKKQFYYPFTNRSTNQWSPIVWIDSPI